MLDRSSRAPQTPRILVSGTASGLGKAIFDSLGGISVQRGTDLTHSRFATGEPFDAIVHCAFNATKSVLMSSAHQYLEDNLLLTQRLLTIPHRKFIYISSLDVYPRLGRSIGEHEDVSLDGVSGPYAFAKAFSDVLVQRQATSYLILRPSTMLGTCMRPNTTLRMLTERRCRLPLSRHSRLNYVLHDDVVAVIEQAIHSNLSGILNIASRGVVALGDIADQLKLSVDFGDIEYDIGLVDNARASQAFPCFRRQSSETLNLFIDSLQSSFIGKGRLRATAMVFADKQ